MAPKWPKWFLCYWIASLTLDVVDVEVLVVVAEEEEGRREGHAPHDGERVLQEQRGGLRRGERGSEIGTQWPHLGMDCTGCLMQRFSSSLSQYFLWLFGTSCTNCGSWERYDKISPKPYLYNLATDWMKSAVNICFFASHALHSRFVNLPKITTGNLRRKIT